MTSPQMSRFRRFTAGTAAAAALAAGIAFAFFLDSESYAGNTATSASIEVESSLATPLSYTSLYPTSSPDAGTGSTEAFTITNNNDVAVSYVLRAVDASGAGTPGAAQFDNLFVRLYAEDPDAGSPFRQVGDNDPSGISDNDPSGTFSGSAPILYEGLLRDLFTESAIELGANSGEAGFTLEMFLLETGAEQPQNATTTFTIVVDAQTRNDGRANELDA